MGFDKGMSASKVSSLLYFWSIRVNPELRLASVVCSYRLGAVISQGIDDGQERPKAYASRTLSSTETNYAQTKREALAIIFVVEKFH